MRDVRIETDLAYPPAMVWQALTDPDALAEWLMQNDFRPDVGLRFTFRTDPAPGFDGIVLAEVLALEPERELRLAWRGGGLDTTVTFRLAAIPAGTRLTLLHQGFRLPRNLLPRFILGRGWRGLLARDLPTTIARRAKRRA